MDPLKATGKPHSLWVSFAKFYEENEQLDDVNAHHQNVHFNLIVCCDSILLPSFP